MKNPDSRQASSGFEQLTFLPKPDITPNTSQAPYISSDHCPKFEKCSAPICPLDANWRKRVLLNGDPTCFYLSESVKHGAQTVFEGAGLKDIYAAMVLAYPTITAKHPRIRRALERAKLTGSRMTHSPAKVIKSVLGGVENE
jgi:hypothetical protein